jgi:hypothetical protein
VFILDIYDRLSGWLKFVVVLAVYAVSSAVFVCCFYPLDLFKDDDFTLITVIIAVLVALGQWGISFATRKLFGWTVFAPAYAVAGATFVPAIYSLIFAGFDILHDDNPLPIIPVLILLGVGHAMVVLTALRQCADGPTAVKETIRGVLGVLMAALVAKLWTLPTYVESGLYVQHIAAPLATLFAGAAYAWRRKDLGSIWIWPAGLVIATAVLSSLLGNTERGDFGWPMLIAAPTAFVPGIAWWLVALIMAARTQRMQLAGLVTDFATREFTGEGMLQPLEKRWHVLVRDLVYVVIAGVLLSRAISRDVAFSYSLIVEIITGAGYAVAFVLFATSLVLRVFVSKRVRPVAVIAVSLISIPVIAVTFYGALQVVPPLLPKMNDVIGALILVAAIAGVVVITVPLVLLWLLRKLTFGGGFVVGTGLFLIGALVCDALFVAVLGANNVKFDIGLAVGDAGSLVTIATVGITYLLQRKQPWAFLIWPVGGVASGLLMRALISFQGTVSQLISDPTIKTDFGGVLVAAVFGALAAAGVLLAKRVWIDKDPDARLRAVRVRGAILILHGIAPVLILVFLGISLKTFVGQAQVDYAATTQSVTLLAESTLRIKDQVTLTVDKIKANADAAVNDVKLAFDEGTALANQLVADGRAAADQAIAAAGRVASAAAGDVAGKAAEVVGQVGDKLKDAFTIPPLDLGFLGTIEFPDLGIGDKISELMGSLFSGLMPSFDLNGMLSSLVNSSLARIDAEFAGPKASAQKMLDTVNSYASRNFDKVRGKLDNSISDFRTMVSNIDTEKEITIRHFSETLANLVSFLYHLLVFIVMVVIAGLLWLLWRIINGLVIMADRVLRGWKMLAYAQEGPAPAPRRARAVPAAPAPTAA